MTWTSVFPIFSTCLTLSKNPDSSFLRFCCGHHHQTTTRNHTTQTTDTFHFESQAIETTTLETTTDKFELTAQGTETLDHTKQATIATPVITTQASGAPTETLDHTKQPATTNTLLAPHTHNIITHQQIHHHLAVLLCWSKIHLKIVEDTGENNATSG